MAVNVAGFRALYSRDPNTGEIFAISSIGPSGPPGPQGIAGPTGPLGPTGLMGVSTVIIGSFTNHLPSELPPTGLLPADWDNPGDPEYQMEIGESLFYEPVDISDPAYGDLWQFVTTSLEPSGFLNVGRIVGPAGEAGPTGPSGATGPVTNEVWFGPELPTGPAEPQVEMWLDTDDNRILGPAEMPLGGATGNVLRKVSGLDGDVAWTGDIVVGSGEVIQFPNVADVPKIHLYSNTFGLGITSGTLNLFASSTIKFGQNSITGAEWGRFSASGLGPSTSYNVTYQNSFTGTMDFRVTPAVVTLRMTNVKRTVDTAIGAQTKICDYPAGVSAPPNISTGYRQMITPRGSDNSTTYYTSAAYIHLDATGVWIVPLGTILAANWLFDATITWARG